MGARPINPPLLHVREVSFQAGNRSLLREVSLEARVRELTVCLGGNGQGKSTLFRILAGLLLPGSGTFALSPAEPSLPGERVRVGAVLETLSEQFVAGTVEDEIDLAVSCTAGKPAAPEPLLELLGLGSIASDRAPQTLSAGEQARFLVALALVRRPRLLILDDPFVYLGWPEITRLLQSLKQVLREGVVEGCLLSTTETEIALHGDSVVIIDEGRAVFQASPEMLCVKPLPARVQRPLWRRCAEARWGREPAEPPKVELTGHWVETLL